MLWNWIYRKCNDSLTIEFGLFSLVFAFDLLNFIFFLANCFVIWSSFFFFTEKMPSLQTALPPELANNALRVRVVLSLNFLWFLSLNCFAVILLLLFMNFMLGRSCIWIRNIKSICINEAMISMELVWWCCMNIIVSRFRLQPYRTKIEVQFSVLSC